MIALALDELLAYTEEERTKWRRWLDEHPEALSIRLQPGGRFPTVESLIDHVFLVEARHLARLEGRTLPESSGVRAGDLPGLFGYAETVREALRRYAGTLDNDAASTPREFALPSGTFRMTPRKLLLHIGVHETRHWAQIALAVRQAGLQPPGEHDLFYSRAVQ
ncbi:MAG: DinB family protein [Acidobacteriota bacterium]